MKWLKLGVGTINTTPLDWEGNLMSILAVIQEAQRQKIGILCLPELALTGYGCEDAFHAPYVAQEAMQILVEGIVPNTGGLAVNIGLPVAFGGALYNCSAFVAGGKLLGLVAKQHLAGDGVHYEPRFFKPWPSGKREIYELPDGKQVPIGDLDFDLAGVRVGFEICEDAWVADRPGIKLAARAVDVILNPSASHFALGKTQTRQRFVVEGSRAFHCAYAYANLLGNEAGRVIYDGEAMIAHEGRILQRRERLSFADWTLDSAWVDLQLSQMARYRQASFQPEFNGVPPIDTGIFSPIVRTGEVNAEPATPAWENSPNTKHEEFSRAVKLGLWDYLRKSKQRGYALSLSGGADSAACAALVWQMLKTAWAECPDKLRSVLHAGEKEDLPALMKRALVCVYQPTKNSSQVTLNAAKGLAQALGARFDVFEVDEIYESYEKGLEKYLGRALNWQDDNLTRQNLQARVRSPGIWAIANAEGRLLITTSNRSEAAVGYCTMDGDTAGSIAPIAGIGKPFILEWNRWIAQTGLKAMQAICDQTPTAELQPSEFKQTDEADLMPYPLLDLIQKSAALDKYSPTEVFNVVRQSPTSKGLSSAQLGAYIERYFKLWATNQWKRERYAPSFHLDDENLDPRSWLRFPILSGGYIRELKKLRDRVKTAEHEICPCQN